MSTIVQILVFIVVGGFIILFASAAGFGIGKVVGGVVKAVLVSFLTAVGLADGPASAAAFVAESFAIAVSTVTVFVLFFLQLGILTDSWPQDFFSLTGIYRLVLVVGGVAVLLATTLGLVAGAMREQYTARNGDGSEQHEISSVYPWEDNDG